MILQLAWLPPIGRGINSMVLWNRVKSYVQPFIPVFVLVVLSFKQPSWSPAGLISRLFDQQYDEKQMATINGAAYNAIWSVLILGLMSLLEAAFEAWRWASYDVKVTTRRENRHEVRLTPGEPVYVDIQVSGTLSDHAWRALKEKMPDLTVEVSWSDNWLEVTPNNLGTAKLERDGDVGKVRVPLLLGTGSNKVRYCPGVLIDVKPAALDQRMGDFVISFSTSHRFKYWFWVKLLRKVRFTSKTLTVRLDRD